MALLIAVFSLSLLIDAYVGLFSRYIADDYCFAAVLHAKGFWGAQRHWFLTWTGRFSSTFMISLLELLGPSSSHDLPAFLLVSWVLGGAWYCWQLKGCRLSILPEAFLFSEIAVYTTIHGTFNPGQSLYWQTGVCTYTIPLVVITLYLAVCQHWLTRTLHQVTLTMVAVGAICAFLLAGSSETYAALAFGCTLLLLLLGGVIPDIYRFVPRKLAWGWLAGTVAATLVMAGSPGNAIRKAGLMQAPNLAIAFKIAAFFSFFFFSRFLLCTFTTSGLCIFLPALVALCRSQAPNRHTGVDHLPAWSTLIVLAAVAPVLAIFCFFPAAYIYASATPGYALVLLEFTIVALTMIWGYQAGRLVQQHAKKNGILAIMVAAVIWFVLLGPLRSIKNTLVRVRVYDRYATSWDSEDRQLKNASIFRNQVLAINPLPWESSNITGLEVLDPDPDNWVNKCMADYYGIPRIYSLGLQYQSSSNEWTPGWCDPIWKHLKRRVQR